MKGKRGGQLDTESAELNPSDEKDKVIVRADYREGYH
jgi:hypothetical protein